MQNRFLFDLNKCTGCGACQIACSIENELELNSDWRQIYTFNENRHPDLPVFHLSLACNHCAEAPCMKYCPALAYCRDKATGAVLIDPGECIGCKYCSWVCPYDAPKFNKTSRVMEKCTFCNHRLDKGMEPACVALCPTKALKLGDTKSEYEPIHIPGFPETGIQPSIEFISLRSAHRRPEICTQSLTRDVTTIFQQNRSNSQSKTSLKSEWTLLAFSLHATILTAFLAASLMNSVTINAAIFLMSGIAGMGISALHLSREFQAYKALRNWRRSWLSREIIFYTTFLIVSAIYLLLSPDNQFLGWAAAIFGFMSLFCMDKIYKVIPLMKSHTFYSAQVFLTGFYYTGIIAGDAIFFGVIGSIKFLLYLYNVIYLKNKTSFMRINLSLIRIILGFSIPFLIFYFDFENALWLSIISAIIGEIIERGEFYSELEIISPKIKIELDYRNQLQSSTLN
jgi:DMSO reductase iron-sulfur subunit